MKEKKVVEKLINNHETISSMESCTGGLFASEITNINGSSDIFKLGLVTYSNEYKEYFGVDKNVIDKYSVYSFETSREMSKNISLFSESTYGVGITGKINRVDENNPYGEDNEIFVTIYNSKTDEYYDLKVTCPNKPRKECKEFIVDKILDELLKRI